MTDCCVEDIRAGKDWKYWDPIGGSCNSWGLERPCSAWRRQQWLGYGSVLKGPAVLRDELDAEVEKGGKQRMDFGFVVCWLVKGIWSKCRGFWWLVLTKKSMVQNQSLRHCEGPQPGHDGALEGTEEGHETGTKGARRERKAWASKEDEPVEILWRKMPQFCSYLAFQSWYSKIDFVSVCVHGCAGLWILALV